MAVSGKVGAIYINTEDNPITFTDEATTKNSTYTEFTITNSAKRYLDKNTAVVVKKNGDVIADGYIVEHAGGVVVFDDAPLESTDVITVSGGYLTLAQALGFFNWSLDLEVDVSDVTTFASQGWKDNKPTLKGWNATAGAYWLTEDYLTKLGKEVVVVLFTDATANKNRYEGFGIISSDGIEDAVDGIIEETIEITGSGQMYYREG